MPRLARVRATLLAGLLLAAATSLTLAAPASAATPGYVRLAHLSPDTPQVDVYLTSFRGGSFSKVVPGVAYGTLSGYERLQPGTYAVAMRPPGAAASSAPLLRTTLTVKSGQAYTVAGVGRNKNISLKVLTDDLSRPASGSARIRVVQASSAVPVVDVATTTGVSIASKATFPSTTAYAEEPAQQWTISATADGKSSPAASQTVQVKDGAIYTALVLDKGTAGLQLVVRADAAGSTSAPVGSVDTGLGGGAPTAGATHDGGLVSLAALVALVAISVAALLPRRAKVAVSRARRQ